MVFYTVSFNVTANPEGFEQALEDGSVSLLSRPLVNDGAAIRTALSMEQLLEDPYINTVLELPPHYGV